MQFIRPPAYQPPTRYQLALRRYGRLRLHAQRVLRSQYHVMNRRATAQPLAYYNMRNPEMVRLRNLIHRARRRVQRFHMMRGYT